MKNPKVALVLGTKNSASTLGRCLKSFSDQSYKNLEISIADNNSTDQTRNIALKYTKKILNKGPERSAQRNFAAKNSTGDYLLVADSDMVFTEKVVESCVSQMQKNKNLKMLVIPEESFGEGFWAKCKKLERSFYVGVDWMEAARFFERKTFEEMGGYNEENTGTEDYDLPARIEAKYGKKSLGRINEYILHDEGRLSLSKTLKKKFYYAQKLDVYTSNKANLKKFEKQSSFFARYALFFKQPAKLLKNPIVGFGMLFMKNMELFFGALGYFKSKILKNR